MSTTKPPDKIVDTSSSTFGIGVVIYLVIGVGVAMLFHFNKCVSHHAWGFIPATLLWPSYLFYYMMTYYTCDFVSRQELAYYLFNKNIPFNPNITPSMFSSNPINR